MSHWHELTAKVDAFFSRVEGRFGAEMQCRTGCSDCCHTRLTVTGVEAAAIRHELASWPPDRRAALAANAAASIDLCGALDANGRCLIYAARPIVCRSHGAPIRMHDRSLPVIQACFRNFTSDGPAAADADCILDQTTLSAMVLAINNGDATRFDLAELLASC